MSRITLSESEIRRYYEARLAKVRKCGKELRAACPIHKSTRESLAINLRTGAWRDDIAAHDFAGERRQTIWHAMKAIHDLGEEITRSRLNLELGEKELKHVGLGYLSDLGEGCFPDMRIEPYVAKLDDATARQEVLHHAHILMTHVHSGERSAEELIDMGTAAFSIMKTKGGAKVEPHSTIPTLPDEVNEESASREEGGQDADAFLPRQR